MMILSLSTAILLIVAPAELAQAADGFVVCTATPTRAGSNRVALLNLSHGDEARVAALTEEYQVWLRSDASVAQVIEAAGIDPRLVRAQAKVECSWAKEQSGAEEVAMGLAKRLRAEGIKVLPTNWAPKGATAPSD
ncbi:MAG: hypothetical protein EOP60_11415 [Sphingomonadales bacterium]|nr:MAG: hypothetical protein EOP60_11415 [Sphingomonadales bacterium]